MSEPTVPPGVDELVAAVQQLAPAVAALNTRWEEYALTLGGPDLPVDLTEQVAAVNEFARQIAEDFGPAVADPNTPTPEPPVLEPV